MIPPRAEASLTCMTTVFVEGLEFDAYHGVSEQERQVTRRFRLDLEAEIEETAGSSDDVADTLDYGELALAATGIATEAKYKTVERAVERIGAEIMARFPKIERLRVRLAKLAPPIPLQVEAAGVERSFSRTP